MDIISKVNELLEESEVNNDAGVVTKTFELLITDEAHTLMQDENLINKARKRAEIFLAGVYEIKPEEKEQLYKVLNKFLDKFPRPREVEVKKQLDILIDRNKSLIGKKCVKNITKIFRIINNEGAFLMIKDQSFAKTAKEKAKYFIEIKMDNKEDLDKELNIFLKRF
jgi:hypothetical protein